MRCSETGIKRACLGRFLFQKLHHSPFRFATFRIPTSGIDAAEGTNEKADLSPLMGIVFHRHRGALILGYASQRRPEHGLSPTKCLQTAHRQTVDAQREICRRVERCDRGKHGNLLIGLGVITVDADLPETELQQIPRELIISGKELSALPDKLFALYEFFRPEHMATSIIPGDQLMNIVSRCMTPAERFVRDCHWTRHDTTWATDIRPSWSA